MQEMLHKIASDMSRPCFYPPYKMSVSAAAEKSGILITILTNKLCSNEQPLIMSSKLQLLFYQVIHLLYVIIYSNMCLIVVVTVLHVLV